MKESSPPARAPMTVEQMKIFISAAQMGIACGLTHRYEWLTNADRALEHGPYDQISSHCDKLWDAFLAFEKGTAGCEEEEQSLDALTVKGLSDMVRSYYNNWKR